MQWPRVEPRDLLLRLERPSKAVDVILDTDTYNEVDDQFALSYLLQSGDRLRLRAVFAAPFHNARSNSPEDGMEKSYHEILNILTLNGRDDLKPYVYRGSARYLPDEDTPVVSEAAKRLAEMAMEYTPDKPLYVIAIAAITNVASALLLEPRIRDRIALVWLGGHALEWPRNDEFNLRQDVAAARVVMGCGLALTLLPCQGVVSAFTTSGPELEHWLSGKNKLCDYLVRLTLGAAREERQGACWTRALWDVTAVGWLLDERFTLDKLVPSPIPEYDDHWGFDSTRPLMRYVYCVKRDPLYQDLFAKLAGKGGGGH